MIYFSQNKEVYYGTPGDPTSLLVCVAESAEDARVIANSMNTRAPEDTNPQADAFSTAELMRETEKDGDEFIDKGEGKL